MITRARAQGAVIALSAVIAYLAVSTMIYLVVKDSVVTAILTNALTALAVIIWRIRAQTHGDSLTTHKRYSWEELALLPVAAVAVNITSTALALWVKTHVPHSTVDEQVLSSTPAVLLVMLGLVLAPLGEEALIRGLIYPVLRRGFSAPTTILVTTTTFALLHGNLAQITLTVPLGIILGCVYERTHRLSLCVGAHTLFNLTAMLTPTEGLISEAGPAFAGVTTIEIVLIWVLLTRAMSYSSDPDGTVHRA